jgi:IclR family transcriptional regulator, acetate operon repressor
VVAEAGPAGGVGDDGSGVGAALGSVAIAGLDSRLPEDTLVQLAVPLHATCAELSPRLAAVLGPNSSMRLDSLDVTIEDFLDQP